MTTSEAEAQQAMLAHHRSLDEEVAARVAAVDGAVADGRPFEPPTAELVAYFAGEVLPHALAEEHSVYAAAGARPGLAATVAAMVDEHRQLTAAIEALARASEGDAAAEQATRIGALFTAHVAKENDVLLPPLVADDGVDLSQLLVQMHRLTEAARQDSPVAEDAAAPDTEAALVAFLLESATELARAGGGDRACRIVAGAWAALRVPRPELAVRVTAALHRLVRLVTDEPVAFVDRSDGLRPSPADPELDVRALAPAQRHESIFATYRALAPGAGFVLVNDHDPKPLRYQFEAEHGGEHTWDTLEAGPTVWRVRIGRPLTGGPAAAGEARGDGEPDLDVRSLPHGQRHGSIFAAYDGLAPGAGFVLVNDHDPKPLRYQFEAEHTGEFTWEYLEKGPRVWRVRIGRVPAAVAS